MRAIWLLPRDSFVSLNNPRLVKRRVQHGSHCANALFIAVPETSVCKIFKRLANAGKKAFECCVPT